MGRTIKIDVLEFNELNAEQQQQAIEKYRNKNYEHLFDDHDAQMMAEDFEYKLTEFGYPEEIKVLYSLSYSQGDGVTFDLNETFSESEIMKVAEKLLEEEDFKYLSKLVKDDADIWGSIKHTNSHYYHRFTFNVEIEHNIHNDMEEDVEEKFIEILNKLQQSIVDNLREFSVEFENTGYKIIQEHQSDEFIKELLIDNEKEFQLDDKGNIYKIW
jgi:hypothetical protein